MKKMLTGLIGVLLTGILVGYGISWFSQQSQEVTEGIPIVRNEELPAREVQLYFTAPDGTFLIPETVEIPGCDEDRDCISSLLVELIQGSRLKNLPVLPKEAEVLAVQVENDLVRINFSKKLVDFHPGGSLTELLSIYSLANSLSENFPYIRQVQLLIDGEVKQTLKGHARIDQPIYADFGFNNPPAMGTMPEQINHDPAGEQLSIEQLIQDAGSQNND
ncbi:MAG: GerMN domain-containing protein [Deltaproteobacteria bacterium]|jgi:hypothetical protein|nr:GerMN domain-containing protein [Deltaproteobacteria bacterium]MCW9049763.1 GerMN domain-containing protein [Deltaproteobacteria bacterium]